MHTPLIALLAVGCSLAAPVSGSTTPTTVASAAALPRVEDVETVSLPDIAERAVKGVVSVTTERAVASPTWMRGPQGFHQLPEQLAQGLGSGVLLDTEGYVITNHHVIDGARAVKVTLADGATFDASVVGSDPRSDIGLLKIVDPPADLQPIPWGDSDALRLGETVLAIGNPFGVGHTLTRGIVSAKGRAMGIAEYEDFIQTDAAINPGNSGGALIDLRGRLVGIPTAIFSRSGGTQGIGFAIPATMARTLADDLRQDGRIDRGWLGVVLAAQPGSLTLAEVTEGSSAEKAGLKAGDVLLSFNDTPTRSLESFRATVALAGADTPFEIQVLRDGKPRTLTGTLARRPDDPTH